MRAPELANAAVHWPRRMAAPATAEDDPRRQHALPRRRRRRLRRQVGHRLRRDRPARRCSASCARRSAATPGRFDALARDRRRHRLLLAEPAARRRRRRGDVHRHLAGHARRRCSANAGAAGPRRRDRASPTPRRCRSRTSRFDLVLGHAVLHHLPDLDARVRASSTACCGPAATLVFAGEPSRYGDRIARVPKRAALRASRPLWRARACARGRGARAATATAAPSNHALERVRRRPRLHARATSRASRARAGFDRRPRPRRGAAGQLVRLGQPHARGDRRARRRCRGLAPVRLPRLPRAAGGRRARCSSRACRRRSSTTCMLAARAPARVAARRTRSRERARRSAGVVDDRRRVVAADHAAGGAPAASASSSTARRAARRARRAARAPSGARTSPSGSKRSLLERRVEHPPEVRRRVDADRGDPLPVAVVLRRLAVEQQALEPRLALAPVEVQVLRQERADDEPRAVVHPAGRARAGASPASTSG